MQMQAQPVSFAAGLVAVLFLAAHSLAQEVPRSALREPLPETIQFNRDIRPILSERCFTCHGPDRTHRTTVFHFDVEESAKQDLGKGHYAIFPGDLEKSAMIQRITAPEE